VISTIKIGGDDDVLGSPVTPMRGWQWKAQKKDENYSARRDDSSFGFSSALFRKH
jgi:hypothetical protein